MITTHVLDVARGRPAAGVPIALEVQANGWTLVGRGTTNADGRLPGLVPSDFSPVAGIYRLTFDTGSYFRSIGIEGFYPEAAVVFQIRDAAQHHHVPLLLSPYGYSTYRGS